jgi:hypothetical protein
MLRIIDRDSAVAGIEKFDDRGRTVDIHCLRHSFATWIGESGISPRAAQKLMRHSDVNLTMRYTHARDEAKTRALRRAVIENLPVGRARIRFPLLQSTGAAGAILCHILIIFATFSVAATDVIQPRKKAKNSDDSVAFGSREEVHPGSLEPTTPGSEDRWSEFRTRFGTSGYRNGCGRWPFS